MNENLAVPHPAQAFTDFTGLDELTLEQLAGFTEDSATARAFERRYLPVALTVTSLCFGSIYYMVFRGGNMGLGCAAFFIGIAISIAAVLHARRVLPISQVSGRRMRRFHRGGGPSDRDEVIYVDLDSRTYFRRVIGLSS